MIPWSPLAGGWLSGRWRKGAEPPQSLRAQRIPQRYDLSLPGNQAKLESQLGAAEVDLDDPVLDRIDEIVAPGTNLNPADAGWTNPALAPAARRR